LKNFISKVALSTSIEGVIILCLTLDIVINNAPLAHTLLSLYTAAVCVVSFTLIAIIVLNYDGFSIPMLDLLEQLSAPPNLIVYMACILICMIAVGIVGENQAFIELLIVDIVCIIRHYIINNALSID